MNDREFAIAEAAVCSQFKPAGWLCKNKGIRWFTESEYRRDIHISAGCEVTPLFEKPATSITQAELDAKDARIRELEAAARDGEAQRVPALHAEQIRVAAVAAIREVTGCSYIKGNDGVYLVDALIVNLLAAAPKKEGE